jgi:site-specific DNA-cytosine methylase
MSTDTLILDAFHGAGGWAEGLRALGRESVGVEYDPDMVATSRAAGHEVVLADVAAIDPRELVPEGERCEGVIASPPCPSFSAAASSSGAGPARDPPPGGRAREGVDNRAVTAPMHDERSRLTVRADALGELLRPEWVALEQVPAVLPVWADVAAVLRAHGYFAWTGLVYAERYGVPQTRQRAVMLASSAGWWASRRRRTGATTRRHRCRRPARRAPAALGLDGEALASATVSRSPATSTWTSSPAPSQARARATACGWAPRASSVRSYVDRAGAQRLLRRRHETDTFDGEAYEKLYLCA